MGPHRLVAIIVGAVLALPVLFIWSRFSEPDALVGLAVPIMALAAFGAFWLLANRLDLIYRDSSIANAFVRLLGPGLFAGFLSAWVMNQALFGHGPLGFWTIVPAAGILVGGVALFVHLGPTEPSLVTSGHQPRAIDDHDTGSTPLTPGQPGPTGPPLVGPPIAPSDHPPPYEPPLAGSQIAAAYSAAPTPALPHPTNRPPGPAATRVPGGSAHLVTSWLITVAWVPLGFVVWFGANYCPDEGEGAKTLILSSVYVLGQLFGNAVAGPLLYGHFGGRGGVLLAIGRSVLAAVALIVIGMAFWTIGSQFGPNGPDVYCG